MSSGRPASRRLPGRTWTWFQPMCGTLTVLGSRRTVPAMAPIPSGTGPSSLPSKSNCMPTQMPSTGWPALIQAATASAPPARPSAARQAPYAPTPGTTPAAGAGLRRARGAGGCPPGSAGGVMGRAPWGHSPQSVRGSCEGSFGAAAAGAGVEGAAGVGDEPLEEMAGLAGIEVAELAGAGRDLDPPHQVGAAGEIDGDARPRLVQRHGGVAEAADAGLVPQRLAERLPERDAGVLDGVVGVDLQVALGPHGQVEAGVLAELPEHVVQEGHAGVGGGLALTVEVQLDHHVDLRGAPLHAGAARPGHQASSSAMARRKASFSSVVPMVTRRWRSRVG